MGEVVVSSSEEVEELKTESETEKETGEFEWNNKRQKEKNHGSFAYGEAVKWERFLPTMALRVLLVEADDSTRQIVAALLRKCNYRVSAVPDSLKAWEILKRKPHNIDLILTEVDLPSISGLPLLTLIMEHEICKSIPVIMMLSQDSISTVYKCMLRGAADYLVKPIRRNELRNLWQDAWRRQASSCTKPDMEAEVVRMENVQEFSHLIKGKSLPYKSQKQEVHKNFNQKLVMHEMKTGIVGACKDAYTTTVSKGDEPESKRKDTNILVEAGDTIVDSPRKAIDFMGTFNRKCNSSSINSTSKFYSSPHFDLSLRRCYPSAFENHVTQERPTLWHPNSSAFTRYSSRLSQPLHSTLMSVSDRKKEPGTKSEKMLSNQTKVAASCAQQTVFPIPVAVKGARLNNMCDVYKSIIPTIFWAQSSSSPVTSPSSSNQQEPSFCANPFRHSSYETNSSGRSYDRLASNANQLTNQHSQKQDRKLDSTEDRGHISPASDQSASSSFCNGSLSQLNAIAYGSTAATNGNTDQVAIVQAYKENKKNDSFPGPGGNSHRSIQREAVLTKSRLKQKDRCYGKKVRYESRKKLAEQRRRVKGQFVRQVQADPTHTQAESHYGNSSDG